MYAPTSLAHGVILLRRPEEVLSFVDDLNEAIAALGVARVATLADPASVERDAHVEHVSATQGRLLELRDALRSSLSL